MQTKVLSNYLESISKSSGVKCRMQKPMYKQICFLKKYLTRWYATLKMSTWVVLDLSREQSENKCHLMIFQWMSLRIEQAILAVIGLMYPVKNIKFQQMRHSECCEEILDWLHARESLWKKKVAQCWEGWTIQAHPLRRASHLCQTSHSFIILSYRNKLWLQRAMKNRLRRNTTANESGFIVTFINEFH